MITTINPATGEIITSYSEMKDKEVNSILEASSIAQKEWANTSFEKRAHMLLEIERLLLVKKKGLSELMTQEMGKPLEQAKSEIEKCALVCRYYAESAESQLTDQFIETEAQKSYITYNPLGTVLAIMPWNFPFWQVFRCAAPVLMAGNSMLLKHAENTTGSALAIEQIFSEAGLPKGLFGALVIPVEKVKAVIEDDRVHAVTFTGSTRAGRLVASQAGKALKPVVLELGGSDPYIILEDADVELAAKTCVFSRLLNSGQSCIAAKRFIITQKIYQPFVEALRREIDKYKVGNPIEDGIQIGPISRTDLRTELHKLVQESIAKGAVCEQGGFLPEGIGNFYPITILTNVQKGMPAYEEELFGPVFSLIQVTDEEEAIKVANSTRYGLGAAIFSNNKVRAEELAANYIEAGSCFINDFVRSDPRLPFGGIKDSGFGRELSSFGIKEFVNIKTVYLK